MLPIFEEPNLREIIGASRAQLKTFKIQSPILTLAPRVLRFKMRYGLQRAFGRVCHISSKGLSYTVAFLKDDTSNLIL